MPEFKAYVRQNLPPLGVSGEREAEVIEELALEFQENYERALRGGLNAEEAWREVRRQARPWHELHEDLRSALGESPIEEAEPPRRGNMVFEFCGDVIRDLRYAVRQLRRSPGFTIVAVLMLALGIGANTAIFSLMNAVLFRTLPVKHPEQLVLFGKAQPEGTTNFIPGRSTDVFSYPFYREFRVKNDVFSEVAAIKSYVMPVHGRMSGDADMEKLKVELVSGTYFNTLGVSPILGRVFTDADDRTPGAHPVVVANYAWWSRRFGSDPSALGKTIKIGQTVYTIVGVTPPQFFGITVGRSPDLWIPLAMEKEVSPDHNGLTDNMFRSLHMIGRPKPGIDPRQTQAETDVLFRQILRTYLGAQPSKESLDNIQRARIELMPAATGRSPLRREFQSPLTILMVLVGIVLLITCANVANLLLTRATARQKEIAVRLSLGAGRPRVFRQLFAESALLGVLGAGLGVVFASIASQMLLAMISSESELVPLRVTPDLEVLVFTVAVTILTVFLFGAAPAIRATGVELAPALRLGRGVVSARNLLSQGLVVAQVALSLVLLASAGLFLRSLANVTNINLGFDKQNVLRFHIDPASAGYKPDARLRATMARIEEHVESLPGVPGASFALSVLDGGGWSGDDVAVPGRTRTADDPHVDFNLVGPEYFEVMKMPLVFGRRFTVHDNQASPRVAVINEEMVRVHFAGSSPIGRTFSVGDDAEYQNVEVVGVIKNAKYLQPVEKQMPAAFFPHAQHSSEYLDSLVVRYSGDPTWAVRAIKRSIGEIDPNLPVSDIRTLSQMVDDFTLDQRLVAQLSTFFAILAVTLACIGIYGVLSYGITRRTNEFGIRIALGAARTSVLWAVLRETCTLTLAGIGIGCALTFASGSYIKTLLYGLQSTDPLAISLAIIAMLVVALAAGYLPARRATRIDPLVALRYE
ncbi:MAG TPA: ABC transporter permease [Bryobacteraceae bacterium]|nr:ABC transporter permease [Bryobacteraceae bacterium]